MPLLKIILKWVQLTLTSTTSQGIRREGMYAKSSLLTTADHYIRGGGLFFLSTVE